MSLPTAVASGAAAATSSAVRPARVGIVAGVLAAVVLFSVYLVAPVPERITSLLGGELTALARHGGLRMQWTSPEGTSSVLEVPGVLESDAEQLVRELAGPRLTFRRVVRAKEMTNLVQTLALPLDEGLPGVAVDQWRPDVGGEIRTDYYLVAHSRAELDALLARGTAAGWSLPSELEIAFEYIEPWDGKAAMWRTYVVSKTIELDGSSIQSAVTSFDPNTNRPLVLLDFTPEAATKFGELTAEIQGEKLATMRGDIVMSAPIINGPIRGGRASITMGGGDAMQQERDARVLAGTLISKPLPVGSKVDSATYVEPNQATPVTWIARGILAVGGGLLLGLVAWAVIRRIRPVQRPLAAVAPGGIPWARVGVTLLAPLAVVGASYVPAFGLDGLGVPRGIEMSQFHIGLLGIMPVITAYVLVEMLAMFIPSWRRRRHAGEVARRPIAHAVPAVAVVLATLQAWALVQYFGQLVELDYYSPVSLGDASVATGPFIASVLGGVGLFVVVAEVIRRWGLGNGYGALIASGWIVEIVRLVRFEIVAARADASTVALVVVAPLALFVIGIALARWRVAAVGELALRIPASGVAPVAQAGGIVALVGVIAALPIGGVAQGMQDASFALLGRRSLSFFLVLVAVIAWSAAFARGQRLDRIAARAGVVGPSRSTWFSATQLSAAVLLAVVALGMLADNAVPALALDVVTGLVAAAVVVDLVHDLRGRRIPRVRVWSLHQPHLADAVERALVEADIPCHLTGAHLRAMLSFFGPFAPIDVYVRPEDATRAHAKLVELMPVE